MEHPVNERKHLMAYLLPPYYRKIGFVVLIFGALALLGIELSKWGVDVGFGPLEYSSREGIIAGTLLLLGLACFAWSKEKDEDEYSLKMRMKAMSFSFMCATSYLLCNTVYQLLVRKPLESPNALPVLIGMIVLYLISYYRQKRDES